jgi:hypothetical protein
MPKKIGDVSKESENVLQGNAELERKGVMRYKA